MPNRKEYSRDYYEKHRDYFKVYMKNYRAQNREQIKAYRKEHQKEQTNYNKLRMSKIKLGYCSMLSNKCFNCSLEVLELNLCVFDFHHLEGKTDNKYEWLRKDFIEKIRGKKIRLLCANCHRLEHHKKKISEFSVIE